MTDAQCPMPNATRPTWALVIGQWSFLMAAAAAVGSAGCQADPSRWHGGLKFLNIHAVAFTPEGRGLLMVGPRRGGADQPNATAYYHLHLPTMTGQRLGYGQYALGQALLCPFADWAAIPVYFPAEGAVPGPAASRSPGSPAP